MLLDAAAAGEEGRPAVLLPLVLPGRTPGERGSGGWGLGVGFRIWWRFRSSS